MPAASVPTVSPASQEFGESVTINTNRASDTYTHRLSMKFGSTTYTLSNVGASTTWTIPAGWASSLPANAISGTIDVECETFAYENGPSLGINTTSFTVVIAAEEGAPDVTVSYNDIGTGSSDYDDYPTIQRLHVQGVSKMRATITATPKNGATIASYAFSIGDKEYRLTSGSTAVTLTSDVLGDAGTYRMMVAATDSRGLTRTSEAAEITVLAYSPPHIGPGGTIYVSRGKVVNGAWQDATDGTYVKVRATNITISGLGTDPASSQLNPQHNNKSRGLIYYRESGTNTWILGGTSEWYNDEAYSYHVYIPNDTYQTVRFSVAKSYEFRMELQDYVTSTFVEAGVSTRDVVFDVYRDGTGFAIGKVAETANKFDVAQDSEFRRDVTIDGDLTVLGTINGESGGGGGGGSSVTFPIALNQGGTGVTASSRKNMFAQLGLEIATGTFTIQSGSLSATVPISPAMSGTPTVFIQPTGFVSATSVYVSGRSTSSFAVTCSYALNANVTFQYMAVYWGNN